MKFVCEGKDGYKMKASDLPSFFYPHGTMYNEENLDSGLFWGHVLIWVFFLNWFLGILLALTLLFRDCDWFTQAILQFWQVIMRHQNLWKLKSIACRRLRQNLLHILQHKWVFFSPLSIILSFYYCLFRYILVCAALNHGAQKMATSTSSNFITSVWNSSQQILVMNG